MLDTPTPRTKKKDDGLKELLKFYADREWRLDHLYFVQNENGERVLYQRRAAQRAYCENQWVLDVIAKARQLGFSTEIAIEITDFCVFNRDKSAGIIDYKLEDAKKKLEKISFAYHSLPEYIKNEVPLVKENEDELRWANGSSCVVGTSHRGGTLQFLHWCLDGSTGIHTRNAIIKPISEIEPGEKVLTSDGRYRTVKAVIKNRLSDIGANLLEISAFGWYEPLRITENHQVLTREFKTGKPLWKPASEIVKGDYLAFPLREPSNNLRDGMVPFGDGRRAPDDNLAWVVGMYLAEGHIRSRNGNPPTETVFAIDKDEVTDLVAALERLNLQDKIKRGGKRINVYAYQSRTRAVSINSRSLASFLSSNFGMGEAKMIPDKIWKWGAPFMRALVKGYFDGDGAYGDLHMISATSIRRQFVDQLRLILMSLRYGVPTVYHAPAGMKYGRQCAEAWTIKLMGPGNWKFREQHGLPLPEVNTWAGKWRIENGRRPEGRKLWRRGIGHYWMRVSGVKEVDPIEFVYDLALDDVPHNYLTVNGIVHNSEAGKTAAEKPEIAMEIVAGALNTISPGQIVKVESTAHGTSGIFHDMVERAKKKLLEGTPLTVLDFKLHFYGWMYRSDYRVQRAHVVITNEVVQYFKELKAKYGIEVDGDQMAWYQQKLTLLGWDKMKEEFPSVIDECFYNSLEGAFFKKELSKARTEGRIGQPVPYDPTRRVHTCWDKGMNEKSDRNSIWWFQHDGVRFRWLDYHEAGGENIAYYASVLEDKRLERKFVYGTHYGPHDLRQRVWGSTSPAPKTMEDIARDVGVNFTIVDRVDDKQISIEAARRVINLSWFCSEYTSRGVDGLDNYQKTWNKTLAQWTSVPLHNWASNPSDALQTGAMGIQPERVPREGRRETFGKRKGSHWSS